MKEAVDIALNQQVSEGRQSAPLKFCFNRIVAATDFTPGSEKAVDYAVQLAQRLGARLTLLHVHFERPEWWESAIDGIEVYDWEQWREAMGKNSPKKWNGPSVRTKQSTRCCELPATSAERY